MRAILRMSPTQKLVLLAATLPLSLSLSVCQAQSADLVLTEQDNGRTVTAFVDESISVQLRGNATTGYTWLLTSTNGDSVSANGPSTYLADESGAVGAGGTFTFPFLTTAAGTTTLSFTYERPWDPGTATQTFAITISVSEKPAPPRLSISVRGTNAILSWPISGSNGFYLEGTQNISSGWMALNAAPIPDGPNYTVTLSSADRFQFFRLRQ